MVISGCSCFASSLYLVFICILVTGGVSCNNLSEVDILEKDNLEMARPILNMINL